MTAGASEEFWGPSLEYPRASTAARESFLTAALLFFGMFVWLFFESTTESGPGQTASAKGAFVAIGLFAFSGWNLVKGLRHSAEARRLKANPPGQTIWYTLSDSGLSIFEDPKPLPPGGTIVPWTAMDSLVLVKGATPLLVLTYRLPGTPTATRAELAGACMRADGVALSDRMPGLYDRRIGGIAKPIEPAPSTVTQP